ncbi:hypothetical protein [Planctomonas deserti]|uniref:hypothetical protein n=1 Tax=Planctomonas deserti TaxID=2144185 RepID=UPI00131F0719|nr:hypothetical protein [Planctomonas deserti]
MSMSEPLLPHSARDDERVAAAEPGGEGAPLPGADEEPDVLPDAEEHAAAQNDAPDDATTSARPRQDPPFRTPVRGDSLTPDRRAAETGD